MKKHLLYFGGVALTAFTLVPAAALAQDYVDLRADELLVIDVDRSDNLFWAARQAELKALKYRPGDKTWLEAAELWVESAEYCPYGDGHAWFALSRAGDIYARAGNPRAARRAYAAAGHRALEMKDYVLLYEAAVAFTNASDLSQKDRRDLYLAIDYYHVAHRLSESPMMSNDQRQRIRMGLGLEGHVGQQ